MDAQSRLLYWLLDASRGGPTRLRILKVLNKHPSNTHQLALSLDLDYKTVQGHIAILLENRVIYQIKNGYGSPYFISSEWDGNEYFRDFIEGENNGKKNRKRN